MGHDLIIPAGSDQLRGTRVVARKNPLSDLRIDLQVPYGLSIAEIFFASGLNPAFIRNHQCWLCSDDLTKEPVFVPHENWLKVRPRPGVTVTFRVAPHGGGGGQKGALGIILRAVVVVIAAIATWYVGGIGAAPVAAGGFGLSAGGAAALGAAAGAAVSLAGNLAINALVPPSLPGTGGNGKASSPTYAIGGTRNAKNPYGPIPRIFGRFRYTPPYGADPYTEIVGNDQYVRCLFVLGYGPLQIEDVKLGDTPILSFQDVEMVIHQGYDDDPALQLYMNDPREEPISIDVSHAAGWVSQTTKEDTDEISLDLTFDRGLFRTTDKGKQKSGNATFEYRYRPVGAADYIDLGSQTYAETSTSPVRRIFRFKPPARGQFDVQARRVSADDDDQHFTHAVWTALRSIQYGEPILMKGLAMIELRIRGTSQLNGVVDNLNALCTSILRAWDGEAWTLQPTRNPAACYIEAISGRANKRPAADEKIAWDDFVDWAVDCDALDQDGEPMFTCDGVVDYATTVGQIARDIASSGRAIPGRRDGKYSIVRDIPQTVPLQHFTPRNSRGSQWNKTFTDPPHALKVRFTNEEKGYQQDELYVYADGYTKLNASKFETLELPLVVRPSQIWRDTRYNMAQAILRPVKYSRSVDPEYLQVRRGDLVAVADDFLNVGLGSARIRAVTTNESGQGTAIVLDDRFVMAAGKTYVLRVRRSDTRSQLISIETEPGETAVFTPLLPISALDLPQVGDLASFGETGLETVPMLVHSIMPDNDLGASVALLDAAPAIHQVDKGPIPVFDPGITLATPLASRKPPQPGIMAIQSDESVISKAQDGSLISCIRITLLPLSGGDVPAADIEVQYRRTDGAGSYLTLPRQPAAATSISIQPVDDGEAYDVRLRSVSATGQPSDWTPIDNYTVIGKSTPPADPTGLRLEGGKARWNYPDPPIDMDGFEVRVRPGTTREWDAAPLLRDGLYKACEADIASLNNGPWVVMVKAKDRAGNYSTNFAAVTINLGDVVVDNLIHTVDLAASGFPGEITGGEVHDGELRALDNDGAFWPASDTTPFWPRYDTDPFWVNGYRALTYTASFVPPREDVPSTMKIDAAISGGVWQILYRTDGDDPFWPASDDAPFWPTTDSDPFWPALGAFHPWPGSITAGWQRYYLQIVISDGLAPGVVSGLSVIFDVPDESEIVRDIVVPVEGAVIPLAKKYRGAIKIIRYTLGDDGGTAVRAKTLSYDAQAPVVGCFDIGWAQTSGLIEAAEIQGIKG